MTPQGQSGGLETAALAMGPPATHGRTPGAAAGTRARKPWAMALSAVVPGLGSLAIGRVASGGWILGGWLIGLATLLVSREDIARTLEFGRFDDRLALGTLVVTLVGFWAWGMYDVAVLATRPLR